MPILPQPPALNPFKDAAKFETINYTADFENLFTRLDSIENFIHTRRSKNDSIRYLEYLEYQTQHIRVNLKEPIRKKCIQTIPIRDIG